MPVGRGTPPVENPHQHPPLRLSSLSQTSSFPQTSQSPIANIANDSHYRYCVGVPQTLTSSRAVTLALMLILLAAAVMAAVMIGPLSLPFGETLRALWGMIADPGGAQGADAVVSAVRVPRVLVAVLVGAGLGVAGAAMQGVFRNPLAEPGITGVSAGAATVAVLLIVTGSGSHILPLGAFLGALGAVAIVQAVGIVSGSTSSLLLVGIALNAFLGAIISATVANAEDAEDARSAMFWLNGNLTGRTMQDVGMSLAPMLIGVAIVLLCSRDLNLLSLGEATAATSGMNVGRTKHIILAGAALATGAGVAITGVISFVGLVVPHVVRLIWGSDHRFLLPASALMGAIFLLVADTAARMLFNPIVLQTGTVTAIIGAPFLLCLVLAQARRQS